MINVKSYQLESLDEQDLPSLMDLENEAFPLDKWSEEAMRKYYQEHPENFSVIKEGQKIIGYLFIMIHEVNLLESGKETVGEIGSIAIDLNHRGKGLGKELLKHGIQQLNTLKASKIILHTRVTNTDMKTLAEKVGFRVRGIVPHLYTDKTDGYQMELINNDNL